MKWRNVLLAAVWVAAFSLLSTAQVNRVVAEAQGIT
jgi:hypothetical protein